MINAIKNLFGIGPKVDYAELVKQGAIILDVRSKGEYQGGHIKGSVNIPLDVLKNNLSKLQKTNSKRWFKLRTVNAPQRLAFRQFAAVCWWSALF